MLYRTANKFVLEFKICAVYFEGTSLKQRIPVREYNLSERGCGSRRKFESRFASQQASCIEILKVIFMSNQHDHCPSNFQLEVYL